MKVRLKKNLHQLYVYHHGGKPINIKLLSAIEEIQGRTFKAKERSGFFIIEHNGLKIKLSPIMLEEIKR